MIHVKKINSFLEELVKWLKESYARIKIETVDSHLLFFTLCAVKQGGLMSEGIFSLVLVSSSKKCEKSLFLNKLKISFEFKPFALI